MSQTAETPPEGQLCDRLMDYPVSDTFSATRGPRGARCVRQASAKDSSGVWACSIHLRADKAGMTRRAKNAARRNILRKMSGV